MADLRQIRWPAWAIAALSIAVISAGLSITGGPLQGRAERRDQIREADLNALAGQARCIYRAEGRNDANLSPTSTCPDDLRQVDPFSAVPYTVEAVDTRNIRLCATFEQPPGDRTGLGRFNGNCVVIALSRGD